jgi:hypothetical protein
MGGALLTAYGTPYPGDAARGQTAARSTYRGGPQQGTTGPLSSQAEVALELVPVDRFASVVELGA